MFDVVVFAFCFIGLIAIFLVVLRNALLAVLHMDLLLLMPPICRRILREPWFEDLLCTLFLPIWLFSVYWLGGEGSWLPNQEYGPANQVGGISVVALLVYYGPYSLIRRWMRK